MIKLRSATKSDVPFLLLMIRHLAEFEKALERVIVSEEDLLRDGFGDAPLYQALVIQDDDLQVGFALFYFRYSTWKGKSLFLEDVFVLPDHRGKGAGGKVMKFLGQKAVEENCRRFEWQVLDWNKSAVEFYRQLGAEIDPEWMNCRLEQQALLNFAQN